jgi:hypothetical protein
MMWFFFFERLGHMHENKKMFFLMFWRKPGILIPDVYFYDVKIQTNIKQNLIKKIRGRITNFWKYFWIFFWTELDPAHSFWIGPDLLGQWTVEHSPLFTCYVNSGEWINSLSTVSRRTVEMVQRRRRRKRGGRLTCDGGGLAGVKGSVE